LQDWKTKMFSPEELPELKKAIEDRAKADEFLLKDLRKDARQLGQDVKVIKPRSTTAISLVASDGGNNKLAFDPFYVQLVRVVDSYGKQLCLDAISPSTDTDELYQNQFDNVKNPKTALGNLLNDLGVDSLNKLSSMIPKGEEIRKDPNSIKPGWVLVYRDLCEWAVLYERICHRSFATDTLIVRDGQLRSKIFTGTYFMDLMERIEDSITRIFKEDKRRVFLVGLAKHSKPLARYNLAMGIEGTFSPGEPRYVNVPRKMEAKAYIWPEYARGEQDTNEGEEVAKFVAGVMYFVRFGSKSGDPIWSVDILTSQTNQSSEIFSYLLADSINGFPMPFYPRCLQKAHEHAQIVDFDLQILQDEVIKAVKGLLPKDKQGIVDAMNFQEDVSARRYE
jgi:hypothetical protein